MSDLLLNWLNEELRLSKYITDIEVDFASGYLFGEILYRLNQQPNFSDFVTNPSSDGKIINFCLLEPSMRALNIKFDSKVATRIMNETSGIAANVLYQIKMAAERLSRVPRVSTKSLETKGIIPLPNMPTNSPKPIYDEERHRFFEHSIRRHVKTLTELTTQKEKLEKEKRWKQEVAQKKQQMQEELELTRAERLHQAFIHSKFIKEALDETDSPAWRLGIQKRKEREQRKIHFHKKMIEQRKTKHALITAKLRHIIENDLNEFDARNKTINQKQGEDTTIIPTCKSLGSTSAPPSPEHTSEAFAERIKQQRLNREKKREDMERKRRKFLQECLFRQSKLNETRVNNVLQDLVLRETNFELEAKKQMKNILKYKEVCQENRIRRDANYQAQLETDAQKEIERDTQQYQHLVQRYGDDISIQHSQKDRFALAELASAHYSNVETATEIVKDILEFMIQIAAKREHTMYTRSQVSTIFLQADTWEENKVMFANKGNQENSEDLLNIFQLQKYLQHFQAESIEEEILERGQYDKSLFVGSEKKLPERFALGEAIKYVRHLSTSSIVPDGQTRSQHQRVIPNFPIKILLFGQPFAGKRTQAYHLADKYNLQVISVLELIDQARTDSSEVSNELKFEITNNLRNGQEISPQIYSRLVLDALSSIPVLEKQGWILYDLPGTHVHAQSLEEHLSGYIDPSLIPTLDDHESILAPGFPREKLPLDFFHGKSGIHLVFDLQTQENNLEERCFGHLQDGTTKEEFHLIYAPQPDPSGIARHRLQQKFVEQHHRNENTSNIVTGVTCEHLSLVQYQSESHFQGSFREWYTKFNTLQIVDANDSVEATTAQMVATIDNLLVKQAANHQMAMQKREEGENVKMESEEVRQRNYAQMEQAIINAKEEVAKAQQAVHAAEVQKAKKNELAELRGCVGSANKQLEACLTEAEEMIKEERIGLGSTKKAYSGVLEPEIAKMIANTWSQMEQTFIEEMKESFTTLRNARISLEDKSKSIVDEFMAFLRRVDNKQTVMIKFQQMFNCVEADMRFENETKEELHARTDVLQKDLCHVVNAKTTENQIELDYVLKEGWKENQTRQLAAIFHRMLQAEGDRFRTSIQVLIDGFQSANGFSLPELRADAFDITSKIFHDSEEAAAATAAPAANTKGVVPAKGKAPPPKPSTSAPLPVEGPPTPTDLLSVEGLLWCFDDVLLKSEKLVKLFVIDHTNDAEDIRETMLNLTNAIQFEHVLMQKRVLYLREMSLSSFEEVINVFYAVENTLRDTISERKLREESAIAVVVDYIRKTIEAEQNLPIYINIQPEVVYRFPVTLQLPEDTVVTVDETKRLLPKLSPEVLPIVEEVDQIILNKRQYVGLETSVKFAASRYDGRHVPVHELVDLLNRLSSTPRTLPSQWKPNVFDKLISHLDPSNGGLVDIDVFLQLILSEDFAGILT